MSVRRVLIGVVASLIVLSVAWATQAQADSPSEAAKVDVTAMGQSLYDQLRGHSESFQFAIEQNDRLELTGESGSFPPALALGLVRSDAFGGSATSCHLTLGAVEAALIVEAPRTDLPQPCAVLGVAYEAGL